MFSLVANATVKITRLCEAGLFDTESLMLSFVDIFVLKAPIPRRAENNSLVLGL